jgi:hypothetical protein
MFFDLNAAILWTGESKKCPIYAFFYFLCRILLLRNRSPVILTYQWKSIMQQLLQSLSKCSHAGIHTYCYVINYSVWSRDIEAVKTYICRVNIKFNACDQHVHFIMIIYASEESRKLWMQIRTVRPIDWFLRNDQEIIRDRRTRRRHSTAMASTQCELSAKLLVVKRPIPYCTTTTRLLPVRCYR